VSQWAEQQGFASNPKAVAGAKVFALTGCANCHTYLGAGSSNLGAPDLSTIGKVSPRGVGGFAAYVADPSQFGDEVMPEFKALGRARLLELGAFLEASKGPNGRR
jgi:mono/diheme cytochrome c family protein